MPEAALSHPLHPAERQLTRVPMEVHWSTGVILEAARKVALEALTARKLVVHVLSAATLQVVLTGAMLTGGVTLVTVSVTVLPTPVKAASNLVLRMSVVIPLSWLWAKVASATGTVTV